MERSRLDRVQIDVQGELIEISWDERDALLGKLRILTGFETVSERIREQHLRKRESLAKFLAGLDRVADAGASLTAYVLFKPDPAMTDADAVREASASIRFLAEECAGRRLPLAVRLNPMYVAAGSRWAHAAEGSPSYLPPRLTDVMRVAEEEARQGVPVYIGLSTEGLSGDRGSYTARNDYSPRLIRYVKQFNDGRIARFPWDEIGLLAAPADRGTDLR